MKHAVTYGDPSLAPPIASIATLNDGRQGELPWTVDSRLWTIN